MCRGDCLERIYLPVSMELCPSDFLCADGCLSPLVVKIKFQKDGVGFEEEILILKLMGLNL